MAKVKIEALLEYLDSDLKKALDDAVRRVLPNSQFDRNTLFKEFTRSVGRKCSTWERVPDRLVETDVNR